MACPYYHGNIDSQEAEIRLLKQTSKDGSFLIRDSGRTKGAYILCLLHEKKIFQYRILTDKNKKLFIESVKNHTARQTSSLNELVEFYFSKGSHNGLKTSLVRGVRPEGMEMSDSDDTEDDETYVDTKYIFGSEKDQPDVIMSTAHQSRIKSAHIYAQPADISALPRDKDDSHITKFYSDQFAQVDKSKVSGEFVRKVQCYVEKDLVADALDMSKEESKLSANHLHKLKALVKEETLSMQRQLAEFLHKVDFLRDVVARPGAKHKQAALRIDSESPFNTIIGLLSQAKQELCTLELEAVNSYNELVGYANVDPLALKRPRESTTASANIPVATFKVASAVKAILSGTSHLKLTVDVQKGLLHIIKESSQASDSASKFTADKLLQIIKSTNNSRMLEFLIEGRRKEAYYFVDIREREHFCQLVQQLKKVHTKEVDVHSISIFCGTWNMGNELAPQLGLQPWLKSQGLGKTTVPALASEPHDLYAIGTQEAKVSESEWVNRMKRLLHNQFNILFHLVDVCTLWQIRLVVFVKPEHKNRISKVQQAVVRTGIANTLGNKGAATISLNFDGTSLCFMCCHLAANRERLARRNQNFRDITKNLSSSIGNKNYTDFDVTNQFNHVFCFGDLNYRVDGEIQDILQMAGKEQYPEMLKLDQLLNTINERKAFYGYDEEIITFPPTYRYKKQDPKNTFNWRKVKKSGIKINAPSWCDRVLWKSLPNCAITNTSYGLVQELTTSDHKPVFSSFTISILAQNISQSVHSITTPIDIRMYDISCEVMVEQSSDKHTDYCVIVMGSCLEAACESEPSTFLTSSEGNETVRWNDTLGLKPSFSDAYYLQTQHVLIAVKTHADGMVIGDAAISLWQLFQSRVECNFECDLTYLGGKTGTVRGAMKAIMKDNVGSAAPRVRTVSNNILVVDDTYASPLGDLSWDDYGETPSFNMPDSLPSVRGRPMSFVSSSKHTGAQRILPPLPCDYDVPHHGAKAVPIEPQSNTESDYYNTNSHEYYNAGKLTGTETKEKPALLGNVQAPQINEYEEDECYESAETVQSASVEPKASPRTEVSPKPRRLLLSSTKEGIAQSIISATIQGPNSVTTWLLAMSMPQYVSVFKRNNWTSLPQISRLTKEQLSNAGVKPQHLFQLTDAIGKF